MSEGQAARPPARPRADGPSWSGRAVVVLVGLIVLVFLVVIAYTALPRWWAQQAGDQVSGSLTTGLVLGFMYGYFGTLLPWGVLALVYRFFRDRWLAWVIGGVTALVLAGPNLLTLWIVVGTGSAAHAGNRTLDVEAPWFRGGMLFGVIAAAVTLVYLTYVLLSRRRARGAAAAARAKLEAAETPPSPPPTSD